jgi:thioredoxin-like negative regulator of GroEL
MSRRPQQQAVQPETIPCVTPTILVSMVSQSTLAVLVSFQARWAETMMPALSEIVKEVAGRLQAVQIEVIAYSLIAQRFKRRIIPTLHPL